MIHLGLPLDQQLGISFTFAIMVFAGLEGASTYMQVQLADRRYLIEDARNELEKAYGILFTILNYRTTETDNGTLLFDPDDKETIMDIMSRYPWMFPEEINDLWQKQKVHKPEGIVSHGILSITTEFRDKMKEEYYRRVKRYNELLRKK